MKRSHPDLVIIRGAPNYYEGRKDFIMNPFVLIEVLSESAKNYDRGEKFQLCRSLPSLREYILINQSALHVEQYSRAAKFRWILTEHPGKDEILKFSSIEVEIALASIYQSVEFTPPGKK